MSRLLQMLQPPAPIPEIKDKEEVKQKYKYWRIRILYSMFMGYALYYFTRKSFDFAMPAISLDLGLDKGQLGLLISVFSIIYGISKFGNGIIGDKVNARYMMAIGLMLTGICNIFFGLSSSLLFFAIFWGLNGWLQALGWPPCTRFLTQWYSHSERGSWWSTFNVSHNVGGFLIPLIVGISIQYFGWRYALFIPGLICIIGGFFLINRLRDTPESLGLPPIDQYRNDYVDKIESKPLGPAESTSSILMNYIIKNPYIWLLAFAYFFVYIIRTGVIAWSAFYLVETKGYTLIGANSTVALFEVGGFFGNLTAGWCSDKVFGAKRGPINVLFSAGTLLSLSLLWFLPQGYPYLDSALMFMIGFSIFGPQMMIGLAAAELSHKQAVATATGFVGLFAYIGAAVAGYPIGTITQTMGWNGFFGAVVLCSVFSVLLLLPLWSVTATSIKAKLKYA